jgi:hypothetical protein
VIAENKHYYNNMHMSFDFQINNIRTIRDRIYDPNPRKKFLSLCSFLKSNTVTM